MPVIGVAADDNHNLAWRRRSQAPVSSNSATSAPRNTAEGQTHVMDGWFHLYPTSEQVGNLCVSICVGLWM